jgi:Domain of unknown function (DUF6484)
MSSLKARKSSKIDPPSSAPTEVVEGTLVAVGEDGAPLVDFPGNPAAAPVKALATARYAEVSLGSAVALMFIDGDRARPLAIGLITRPVEPVAPALEERLTLSAAHEIVLQCGRASLVLTRAGKVLLRGAYVSSRSTGMQRITGASVQIN